MEVYSHVCYSLESCQIESEVQSHDKYAEGCFFPPSVEVAYNFTTNIPLHRYCILKLMPAKCEVVRLVINWINAVRYRINIKSFKCTYLF